MGDSKIVLFSYDEFFQPNNPFYNRIPLPQQRSNLPGYVVVLPDPALVAARKRHDQAYDQDLQKVYHNAFIALYNLGDSPRFYYLQDEGCNTITLRGQPPLYQTEQSANNVHELVPESQKAILGDYWRVVWNT